jgi:hypothetical protein
MSSLRVRSLALALIAAILPGCHSDHGPERVVVFGKVTFNGNPIADGAVLFAPTTALPTAAGKIIDGRYKVDALGGVPIGTHRVQFEAFRTDTLPGKDPHHVRFGDTVRLQYLPEKYNTNSQLEIAIPPGSGPINKDFDLTQ